MTGGYNSILLCLCSLNNIVEHNQLEDKRERRGMENQVASKEQKEICDRLHEAACNEGRMYYVDPFTDLVVFTRLFHLKKGKCCKCVCRHCPWNFKREEERQEQK